MESDEGYSKVYLSHFFTHIPKYLLFKQFFNEGARMALCVTTLTQSVQLSLVSDQS